LGKKISLEIMKDRNLRLFSKNIMRSAEGEPTIINALVGAVTEKAGVL